MNSRLAFNIIWIYVFWVIWKKRDGRTFHNKELMLALYSV